MIRWGLALALVALACARKRPEPPAGVLTLSIEEQASWVRNFNPLAPAGSARWPTMAGIYEPLLVWSAVRGEYVPWLATAWEWSRENRLLRMQLRPGVAWSDGKPFTAGDVAFTFHLLRQHPALDRAGVWSFISEVRADGDGAVEFDFPAPFLPGLEDLVRQPIVPAHVWKDVADPVTFANENPVATGPFTEVRIFQNQLYELGRNPHYWQPGKPAIEALRFPAYSSNERANLALVYDEVDWAGNFVPAIDRVYTARDPAHHQHWFPLTGTMVFLYANTVRAPFDDVRVRKALSLAIDRKLMVDVAVYGYTRPADATGLSDAYAKWRSPQVAAEATWTAHDAARAAALFDQAGLARGPDGVRRRPDGAPLHLEILTVSGWSDWVRSAQVIARGLRAAGLDASVRTYDFSAWFDKLEEGDFDLSIGWSNEGPTPYTFYRWLMATATVKPLRVAALGNWQRYGSKRADVLLAQFEREADPAKQHALADGLQRVFAEEAPAIPLYANPSWSEFNTRRFTGFPTAQDPTSDASPNRVPECLLVLTSLRARP